MCTTLAPASYASLAAVAISLGVTGILNFFGSVRTPLREAVCRAEVIKVRIRNQQYN